MLRANIANFPRSSLRGCGPRPLTSPPQATNVRTAMYKHDKPDGTTSHLEWTPKTWAVVGASILGVAGGYGYMMGNPQKVVRSEGSPVATTEKASAKNKNP